MFKLHFYVHILSHNPTLCVGFFLVHTYSRLLSLSLSFFHMEENCKSLQTYPKIFSILKAIYGVRDTRLSEYMMEQAQANIQRKKNHFLNLQCFKLLLGKRPKVV